MTAQNQYSKSKHHNCVDSERSPLLLHKKGRRHVAVHTARGVRARLDEQSPTNKRATRYSSEQQTRLLDVRRMAHGADREAGYKLDS